MMPQGAAVLHFTEHETNLKAATNRMDRSKPKALTLMIYTLYTNNNTLHTLGRSRGVAFATSH